MRGHPHCSPQWWKVFRYWHVHQSFESIWVRFYWTLAYHIPKQVHWSMQIAALAFIQCQTVFCHSIHECLQIRVMLGLIVTTNSNSVNIGRSSLEVFLLNNVIYNIGNLLLQWSLQKWFDKIDTEIYQLRKQWIFILQAW